MQDSRAPKRLRPVAGNFRNCPTPAAGFAVQGGVTAKTLSHWKKNVLRGEPGHRFRDRYWRNKRSREGGSWVRRAGRFVIAMVAIAVGAVFAVIPGPAVVFFVLAGGLLASDWLWLAGVLDAGEVRARRVWHRLHRLWQRLPRAAHIALVVLGAALSAGSAYAFYHLMN
jgi:hypothetical protein